MNITELARTLKITPQELRNNLPQLGFDIGQKAIKINRNVANKIIKDWPVLRRQIEKRKENGFRRYHCPRAELYYPERFCATG